MKPTGKYIADNLQGLWEEVNDQDISDFYKGVISEMMKEYADEKMAKLNDTIENVRSLLIKNNMDAAYMILVSELSKLKEELI